MENELSKFRIATMGIVAADKLDNTRFIEVYPTEFLPFFEGAITDEMISVDKEGMTVTGEKYSVNLKKSMTVKADWLGETNRRTAPTIKRGEQVKLWTILGSERYWWEPLGRDDKLRTTEKVTYAWSAKGKAGELNASNSYYITIDTIDKHVTLSTSAANGEVTAWVVQINAADGNFTITDTDGDTIQIDAANKRITVKNADDSSFVLDGKNILLNAKENFDAKLLGQFIIKCLGFSLEALTTNIVSPTIGLAGNISMAGTDGEPGICNIVGTVNQTGSLTVSESINATTVTAESVQAGSINSPAIDTTNINTATINTIPIAQYLNPT